MVMTVESAKGQGGIVHMMPCVMATMRCCALSSHRIKYIKNSFVFYAASCYTFNGLLIALQL